MKSHVYPNSHKSSLLRYIDNTSNEIKIEGQPPPYKRIKLDPNIINTSINNNDIINNNINNKNNFNK